MKTPIDPEEELLQLLATSLLRDVFAAGVIAGIYADPHATGDEDDLTRRAFSQADNMIERSHTPALIEQIRKLKS